MNLSTSSKSHSQKSDLAADLFFEKADPSSEEYLADPGIFSRIPNAKFKGEEWCVF